VTHKANSFFIHLVLFSDATSDSSDDMTRSLRSREMVWLQVVRGLRRLLPGDFHFMACFGSLCAFVRVRCPYQFRRIFWSMMLRGHWPVFFLTLKVHTLSCHLILRMRRRFLESKLSIRFFTVLVTVHVSAPYKTMGTVVQTHFTCIEKDLLFQILLSLLTASAAFQKRVFISSSVRLSSVTITKLSM